jgi:hypothetical protein
MFWFQKFAKINHISCWKYKQRNRQYTEENKDEQNQLWFIICTIRTNLEYIQCLSIITANYGSIK